MRNWKDEEWAILCAIYIKRRMRSGIPAETAANELRGGATGDALIDVGLRFATGK